MAELSNTLTEENVVDTTLAHAPVLTQETGLNPATIAKPKPKRKPKEEVRDLEILHNLPPTKMSEKEKVIYITALRDVCEDKHKNLVMYQENCESAYKQKRDYEEKYLNLKTKHLQKMNYMTQLIKTAHQSILYAAKEENING